MVLFTGKFSNVTYSFLACERALWSKIGRTENGKRIEGERRALQIGSLLGCLLAGLFVPYYISCLLENLLDWAVPVIVTPRE